MQNFNNKWGNVIVLYCDCSLIESEIKILKIFKLKAVPRDSSTAGDWSTSTFLGFFFFMLPRRSPCLMSDQERLLASGSLPLSSFSSSYSSSPSGRKSNLGRTQTRAVGLRLWWVCQPFPQKPATCCTRPAWGQRGSSSKPYVCRVHRRLRAPMVKLGAALEALHRSWCVPLPTPLYLEDSATRAWGVGMVTRLLPVRAVRYAWVCMKMYLSLILNIKDFAMAAEVKIMGQYYDWAWQYWKIKNPVNIFLLCTTCKIKWKKNPRPINFYHNINIYGSVSFSSLFWWCCASVIQFLLLFGRDPGY